MCPTPRRYVGFKVKHSEALLKPCYLKVVESYFKGALSKQEYSPKNKGLTTIIQIQGVNQSEIKGPCLFGNCSLIFLATEINDKSGLWLVY